MNVLSKINAGHYNVHPDYPSLDDYGPKEYIEKKQQYMKRYHHLRTRFKNELLEEHGLDKHPKADILFDIAWELGKGEYLQVHPMFEMLSELLK